MASKIRLSRAYDDLRVEPTARTTGTNTPSFEKWFDDAGLAIVAASGTSRGIYLYSFDDAAVASEKEVFFEMQLPHGWNLSTIDIHVHWIGSHNDTTAAPRWGLEYGWKSLGQTYAGTSTVYTDGVNYVTGGTDADVTAGIHYISQFASITPGATQNTISSVLIGRIFRNSSSASDTYNVASNKCGLLYIDAHIVYDSIGSIAEYNK